MSPTRPQRGDADLPSLQHVHLGPGENRLALRAESEQVASERFRRRASHRADDPNGDVPMLPIRLLRPRAGMPATDNKRVSGECRLDS
jgi:hypothetical protein